MTNLESRRPYLASLLLGLGWMLASRAFGVQVAVSWDGGAGTTNWNDALNWSTNVVPNNGTPAGTTYVVSIDDGVGGTGFAVGLNSSVGIDKLIVGAGDSLTILNARLLTIVNSGTATGAIANSGTIVLASTGAAAGIRISGDVSLSGGGAVVLINTSANQIIGVASADRLTNVDNVISGGGLIGNGTMKFTNQGTLAANAFSPLTVDVADAMVENSGTIQVAGGSTLLLGPGDVLHQVAGSLVVGGTLTTTGVGFVDLQGGTLSGAGTLSGDVVNAATVAPGSSTATLTIQGNFEQAATGTLAMELAGPAGGSFDRVQIGGTATFGGFLDLTCIGGFEPAVVDNFPLASFASETGVLTLAVDPLCNAPGLELDYGPGALTLFNPLAPVVFLDGFEGSDTCQWSARIGIGDVCPP